MQPEFDFSVSWPVPRAPIAPARTVQSYEASRSGSDRVTPTHQKKAGQLLELFRTRGPLTLNECADALSLPLSSVCSLKWCIRQELEEVDTVTIPWVSGRWTTRTRWQAKR